MDVEKFDLALAETVGAEHIRNRIGTYSEGTLHAVLKKYYEPNTDRHELKVGNYVADIVGQNGIIEIQTRQLYKMKSKVEAFLEVSDVTVVYPVDAEKYIIWRDRETGEVLKRRRSLKKGNVYSAMAELYSLREFVSHPHFHFIAVLLRTEDFRDFRRGSDGKKRAVRRFDRIPLNILGEEEFYCKNDYARLVPNDIPERFTSADLAKCSGIQRSLAQLTLNLLYNIGIVDRVDRNKSGYIYTVK